MLDRFLANADYATWVVLSYLKRTFFCILWASTKLWLSNPIAEQGKIKIQNNVLTTTHAVITSQVWVLYEHVWFFFGGSEKPPTPTYFSTCVPCKSASPQKVSSPPKNGKWADFRTHFATSPHFLVWWGKKCSNDFWQLCVKWKREREERGYFEGGLSFHPKSRDVMA